VFHFRTACHSGPAGRVGAPGFTVNLAFRAGTVAEVASAKQRRKSVELAIGTSTADTTVRAE
jgi:hypothetical protein